MNPFWTDLLIDVLLVIYVLDCAFMGLVIMMQRSKQEGLGAAFGGGITDSVFGAQTSQVLVKATVYAAIIFFALSTLLARLYAHRAAMSGETSTVQQELSQPVAAPLKVPVPAMPTNSAGTPVVPTATPMVAPVAPAKPSAPAPAPSAPIPAKPSPAH
jgi:preprotein translocase subunit SecG